jgi:DNA-binding transcriptional LysR family regulator
MELRHLRYFIAVAEEGHITRAAERLGMQQPPLSQQIKAIERELDVLLFRRKARGVELTDAGSRFLAEARVMIDQLNRAIDSTRRTARGELGRICVGVTSTSSFHPLVARAIRAFSEACPKVSLTLEESLSNDLLDGLRDERMDVAFIRTAPADPKNLVIERLLDEPMVVALSRDHPLARSTRNASIPLKRLASESFILYGPPGTGMYDTIIAACHAAGFNPSVGNLGASTQQGPRIGSTLSLIAAGLGITFVPSSLQRMNIEGVAYRRLRATTPPTTRLSLATRRGDQSPTVKQFITVVRKSAKIPLM